MNKYSKRLDFLSIIVYFLHILILKVHKYERKLEKLQEDRFGILRWTGYLSNHSLAEGKLSRMRNTKESIFWEPHLPVHSLVGSLQK